MMLRSGSSRFSFLMIDAGVGAGRWWASAHTLLSRC